MDYASARRPGPRRRRSRVRSFVTALQILILVGISASVGAGLAMFVSLSTVLPKIDEIEAPEATIIYSSDQVVLARIFREDRTNVPLKDMPKSLRDATVAIEDSRFYQHSGVDMRGIVRAVWANVRGHRLAQGGSTITQQLARNVYLSRVKTVERKAQEAVLAILMERHFDKDRILELYLNRVYYGSGAFGVEAASKVYFGKDVGQLNLSEAALLAGMPKKPSGYSPHEDLEAAIGRRDVVLQRMAELGYITPDERDQAMNEKITIVPRARGRKSYKAAHFVDYVVKQLRERYGEDLLFNGGLRVWTTLNYGMQQAAEKALREGVHRFEKSKRVTEGCFVAIEPGSGYIRAMVGSVDPASQFNRCTQGDGQQPGSSFKAFVYAAAFAEGGMTPRTRIKDEPTPYPGANGKVWRPRNYDGRWHGWVAIKAAIAQSINIPAIKVADKVGIGKVIQYAELMGIHSKLQPYLSTAIGASEVKPLEMASAYGTFANGGKHVEPVSVVRVTNSRGDIIEDFTPEGRQVISEHVNDLIDECLRAVVVGRGGTGYNAAAVSEARGKTGTTNDDRDAWFIGYVPNKLVAACWVGNDNNTSMRGAYGGLVCAPVWREFMLKSIPILDKITATEEKGSKPKQTAKNPDERKTDGADSRKRERTRSPEADVVATDESDVAEYAICDVSGKLATDNCPSHMVQFVRGTQPKSYCSTHGRARPEANDSTRQPVTKPEVTLVTVTVCSESGLLAGTNCPSKVRKRIPIDEVPTQVCNVRSHGAGR